MKIYIYGITHEISDYGLSDMTYTKAFTTREAAEAWSDKAYEDNGFHLDIMEIDIES
jgi:hypothetical protein